MPVADMLARIASVREQRLVHAGAGVPPSEVADHGAGLPPLIAGDNRAMAFGIFFRVFILGAIAALILRYA